MTTPATITATLDDAHVYRTALEIFGHDAQVDMCIEECAELTVELQHAKRGRDSGVHEEIADVLIMAEQMRLLFGADEVDRIKAEKLGRLKMRLMERRYEQRRR